MHFLALLELCKQGRVALDQGHTFGDLEVAWVGRRPAAGGGRWPGVSTSTRADVALSPEARAIEAVLMVAVEPVPAGLLAELLELPVEQIEPLCDELAASCRSEGAASRWSGSPAGTASRPTPIWPPTWSGSPTWACRPACRPPPSRPWPSWPTSSRCPGPRSPPCAGVNVDGVVRLLEHRGYIAVVGRAAGPGQAVLYATTDAFLERLASTASTSYRRSRTCCRVPRPSPRWRSDAPRRGWVTGRPDSPTGAGKASGSRRCWPGSASGTAGPVRS